MSAHLLGARRMNARSLFALSLIATAFAVGGCSASSSSSSSDSSSPNVGADTNDVVGVEDLASVEAELGLVKDRRNADGQWSRGDAKLTAGACYKKAMAANPNWEFRRYVNGAAFFPSEQANVPGHGESRALTCVDVDMEGDRGGALSIEGFALDAALRFHLGRPLGVDAAMMHVSVGFERGYLYGQGIDAYCGVHDLSTGEGPPAPPAINAGVDAYFACHQGGGEDSACLSAAQKACVDSGKKEMATTMMLSRPSLNGVMVSEIHVAGEPGEYVPASLAAVTMRYAEKKAKSADIFNMSQDPVGTLTKIDHGGVNGTGWITHARFSRLDVHYFIDASREVIAITPKSSDDNPEAHAVALCKRSIGNEVELDCEAAGQPLAR
jgi:hypothetical protein